MSKLNVMILLAIFVIISPISSQAKVNIFACEPEWKSLADEIGGNNVSSFSATSAKQDPHHIRAKPSLIAKIRKTDLLICSGADLEIGWLPILLQNTNSNIQPHKVGYFMVSDILQLLEKLTILDRSMGDIHAQGNPHLHLNPHNILLAAKELNNRLQEIDPDNSKNYQANYDKFSKKWQNSIKIWENKAIKLQGKHLITHHKSFSYLLNWLKINEIATLEAKSGVYPTISHLKDLLQDTRKNHILAIVRTPYDSDDASVWLSQKSEIKAIILPYTVGGDAKSKDLFTLFDRTINLLIESL